MPTSPTPLLILPVRVVLESDALIFFLEKTSSTPFLGDLFESNVNVNVSASYLHPSLRQSQLLSPDPGSFLWSLIMAMNLQHWGDC